MEPAAPAAPRVRVYLLDDHEIVRRGLRELLESTGTVEVIGESASAQEARRRIPAMKPDVAVLDGRLGDGNGIEVCRHVRGIDPRIRVIILTSYDEPRAKAAAFDAGASAYLLKEVAGADLVQVLTDVASGRSFWKRRRTTEQHPPAAPAATAGRPVRRPLDDLTDQERRVLSYVAEGLTNRQIAQRMHLADATVKNYVSNLLGKLGMERRTQAAVYATRLRSREVRDHR